MPFSPEIEARFEKSKKESLERWAKMTEQEKDEIRKAGRSMARKVRSCYYDLEPAEKNT
jgi:vacuolar-type H+-ATPase subunit H